ncbi:hypothetical protein AAG570_011412 [Ranatra chinensis]|uniref:Uncharacterized protein n=1 Tax=Ranatra chinensis TaxID=642074 RepID=A0ABD0YKS9_9HEMI
MRSNEEGSLIARVGDEILALPLKVRGPVLSCQGICGDIDSRTGGLSNITPPETARGDKLGTPFCPSLELWNCFLLPLLWRNRLTPADQPTPVHVFLSLYLAINFWYTSAQIVLDLVRCRTGVGAPPFFYARVTGPQLDLDPEEQIPRQGMYTSRP